MIINIPTGGFVVIDDTNPIAVKIRQGYSYTVDDSGTVTFGDKTGIDIEALKVRLDDDTATIADLRKVLKYIVKKLL